MKNLMKAALLYEGENSLRIKEIPVREPKEGEVLVKIHACGVCGSDVHLVAHGTLRCKHYPGIPGHEASGEVVAVGKNANRFRPGDRVVISAGVSCGKCDSCLSGRENFCKELGVFGFDLPGSFAEYNTVEERYLHRLPDSVPYEVGAILADAVSTPYHAIRYRAKIEEHDSVAVVGCGGLGIHAVVLARIFTKNRLVAVDLDEGALENASRYGADILLPASKVRNLGKELKTVSGGLDVLLDFTGNPKVIESSLRAMNPGGRIVMVGIGREPLVFQIPFILIEKMITITGSYGSDRRAIPELITLIQGGKLDLNPSITSSHPLEEVNECIYNLETRKGNPIRFVIKPSW